MAKENRGQQKSAAPSQIILTLYLAIKAAITSHSLVNYCCRDVIDQDHCDGSRWSRQICHHSAICHRALGREGRRNLFIFFINFP
ncbi:hypothetical protein EON65_30090 [archaeon]|nr:MAG: hypothetical protein EON65_30090 [archaeon]